MSFRGMINNLIGAGRDGPNISAPTTLEGAFRQFCVEYMDAKAGDMDDKEVNVMQSFYLAGVVMAMHMFETGQAQELQRQAQKALEKT